MILWEFPLPDLALFVGHTWFHGSAGTPQPLFCNAREGWRVGMTKDCRPRHVGLSAVRSIDPVAAGDGLVRTYSGVFSHILWDRKRDPTVMKKTRLHTIPRPTGRKGCLFRYGAPSKRVCCIHPTHHDMRGERGGSTEAGMRHYSMAGQP